MTRFANRGTFASAMSTFAVAAALVAGPVALAHAADTATPPTASVTTAAPAASVKAGTQVGTSDIVKTAPGAAATVKIDKTVKTDKATKLPEAAATAKGAAAPSVAETPKAPDAAKPAVPTKADAHKAVTDKDSKAPAIKTDEKTTSTKL